MMDKKQVNDVLRHNVALLSKLSEQEVGMMPATEAPLPSVDQVKCHGGSITFCGSGEGDHIAGQAYHLSRLF